jgi:hypothetical protein
LLEKGELVRVDDLDGRALLDAEEGTDDWGSTFRRE